MAQKMCLVMMMVLVLVTVECDLKASNIPFSPSRASLLEVEVILPQEGDTTICFRNCTLKCGANMDCMHNCLKNCPH
ncbi:unnamed protein product [Brassica oleracea var. botrytis]|uniref:(rape) hypothetical protein n=1 Tax=Brassica napus TaxID=3708 RepID=A0A078JZZ6_BRANA|nr:hypothetical protein HID58_050787 [Brassica napus]CAF1697616.1 unnamed protein product [Brassica napus]CDY71935.1 BnaCnng75190D [Brassica napus]